jgi:hypothetical protein
MLPFIIIVNILYMRERERERDRDRDRETDRQIERGETSVRIN